MRNLVTIKHVILCLLVPAIASCALEADAPTEEQDVVQSVSVTTSGGGPISDDARTNAITCSGPGTMTGSWSGGVRSTAAVTVSCTGTVSRIRVWGSLSIKGVVKDSKDVTCTNTSSCTMPGMAAAAGQNDVWTSTYSYNYSL